MGKQIYSKLYSAGKWNSFYTWPPGAKLVPSVSGNQPNFTFRDLYSLLIFFILAGFFFNIWFNVTLRVSLSKKIHSTCYESTAAPIQFLCSFSAYKTSSTCCVKRAVLRNKHLRLFNSIFLTLIYVRGALELEDLCLG